MQRSPEQPVVMQIRHKHQVAKNGSEAPDDNVDLALMDNFLMFLWMIMCLWLLE
jgi:hypothetical protein